MCAVLTLGCLLGTVIAFVPRFVIILAWLFNDRWGAVWDTWFWPTLGFIFAPYTTIFFVVSWNAVTGVTGGDWLWIGLGAFLDIIQWAHIIANRRGIPYYEQSYA